MHGSGDAFRLQIPFEDLQVTASRVAILYGAWHLSQARASVILEKNLKERFDEAFTAVTEEKPTLNRQRPNERLGWLAGHSIHPLDCGRIFLRRRVGEPADVPGNARSRSTL